jgi:hypothetical protein
MRSKAVMCDIISLVTVMRARFVFSTNSRQSVRASHDCDKHEKRQVGGFLLGDNMKQCCGCEGWKTYEEMVKDNRKPDGMGYICLRCSGERKRLAYATKPELREKNHIHHLKYYAENAEKMRANAHRWNLENPDRRKAWKVANAEKRRQQQRNRKARKKAGGGTVTLMEWENLKLEYNHTCLRCGKQEPEIKLTQDHVLPLIQGGKHMIDNIQPLCEICNASKNRRYIDYRPNLEGSEKGCIADG